jgi:ABC-type antimicrobial peptide transport system permease subunit
VDITDATPINNLFVNDDEFENAMDEALKVVQAGVEDYFGKDNTSPIAHLLENYLTERSNETAFYTKTNNSFFDEGMPRGFEYLTLAPYGDPNEIASYNLSINTIDNYPVTVDDFKLEALTKKRLLDPVQQLVKNISFLATTMAILISLILIYLILKENNRIIKILKIMGYRKKEIIKYLIFGYVLSSILAGALAILISYLMYKVITDGLSSAYKIQFVCHYSVGFVLTDIFIVLGFVLVVFLSILFVSRKTKVNSIEQAN